MAGRGRNLGHYRYQNFIYSKFTFSLRRMSSITAKLLLLGGMALTVLPEPVPALEQTCRGCLEACCKTHECIYESESGACTLRDCTENFCPKCVGLRLNPSPLLDELEAWLPLSLIRWPPRIVPKDHGVSGRPPLVLKEGQVFVDGVEVVDRNKVGRKGNARRNKP